MSQAAMKPEGITGVPLLDLKAQYALLRDDIETAILEVCASQNFIMGPKVIQLEESVAEYSQTAFGIGVSSGTDALLVALMALDVGPGDEVITTPFTFFATGGVIARLGARPVFCDIDPDTYNLDATAVSGFIRAECRTENGKLINNMTDGHIKVLMPVHLFGQTADMEALMAIARENNLKVIEDAAQAIGAAEPDGRRAGSIGDIGCLSFFPSKNLGAFGDGGMCVTQDEEVAEKLRVLRVHGGKPKYYHGLIGGNFRLDAIQAAILQVKLRHLDDWTTGRQANAASYDCLLAPIADRIKVPVVRDGARHIFNQYTIRTNNRDGLLDHLKSSGIGTEIYYPVPLHLQKCFDYLGYSAGDFPESEAAAESVLSIPIYPELGEEQRQYVADHILGILG